MGDFLKPNVENNRHPTIIVNIYIYDRAPDITEAWQRHLTGAIAILHFIPAAALSQIEAVVVSERHALPTYLSCRFRMNEINSSCHITPFQLLCFPIVNFFLISALLINLIF